MIIPSKCPICGDILVNDFFPAIAKSTKACDKRLNHIFKLVIDENYNLLVMSYTDLKNSKKSKFSVSWNFVERRIFIGPSILIKGRTVGPTTMTPGWEYQSTTKLPWFEPDLSDFPKLLNKIKTYMCFS